MTRQWRRRGSSDCPPLSKFVSEGLSRKVSHRQRLTRLNIEDHLEGLLVKGSERVQTGEVEVVLDEVFADFGKVLVPR